jgi:hypothetical protein
LNWKLVGEIIGYVAVAEGFLIFLSSRRDRILIFKFIADVLWTASHLFLGNYTGAILNGIAVGRESVFYNRDKRKWASTRLWLLFFLAVTAASPMYSLISGKEGFSMLHVILAAYVRAVAQYPYLNRFVSGQRIYHRHDIEVIMMVKRSMSLDAPETAVKVIFSPSDTIYDVYEKFYAAVSFVNDGDGSATGTDKVSGFFRKFPRLLFRWTVRLIGALDYWGMCPKALMDALPFWGSMIITSMGSLGIKPIYHHLYNFGNLPIFVSYGTKRRVSEIDRKGNVVTKKVIDMKVVTDERICDGFEYATAFKYWRKLIENPQLLVDPPEVVNEDID